MPVVRWQDTPTRMKLGRFEIGFFLQSGPLWVTLIRFWLGFQYLKMGRLWFRYVGVVACRPADAYIRRLNSRIHKHIHCGMESLWSSSDSKAQSLSGGSLPINPKRTLKAGTLSPCHRVPPRRSCPWVARAKPCLQQSERCFLRKKTSRLEKFGCKPHLHWYPWWSLYANGLAPRSSPQWSRVFCCISFSPATIPARVSWGFWRYRASGALRLHLFRL